MQGYRLDMTKKVEDNIKQLFQPDEKLVKVFDVVALDYNVIDFTTPKIYLSSKRLYFTYDEALEVYNLEVLEVVGIGNEVEFSVSSLMFSPTYRYNSIEDREKIAYADNVYKISINEVKQVPKYFMVRDADLVGHSFKSWAFMQIINNVKGGVYTNSNLEEMLNGFFNTFNQKTAIYFIVSFLIYVVLKLIIGLLLPQIFSTVLDYIFGAIILFIMYWLYGTVARNLKKYESIYNGYSHVN